MNRRKLLTLLGLAPVAAATGAVAAKPASARIQIRDRYGKAFVDKVIAQDIRVVMGHGVEFRVMRDGAWTPWYRPSIRDGVHLSWTFRDKNSTAPLETGKTITFV